MTRDVTDFDFKFKSDGFQRFLLKSKIQRILVELEYSLWLGPIQSVVQ